MKKNLKYIVVAAFLAMVVGCLEIAEFVHPETAPVNSKIEASFNVNVHVDKDLGATRTKVIVGILAPVDWHLAENAVVTYSSDNMPDGPADKLPMRLTNAGDLTADTQKMWNKDLTDKMGFKGNYEPVEWVTFISEKTHNWQPDDQFNATLNISYKTGSENVKTNLVYFIGSMEDGVHNDPQYYLLQEQLFTTTGGSNALIDYTIPKMCFMEPANFTYEDILAYTYDPTLKVDGKDSPLVDADEVYFMATATYDGGKTITVDEISEKTKMLKEDKFWKKYMYPHEYFQIPASKKIEKIEFLIVNKDKSLEAKLPNGNNFMIPENNK